MGDELECRLEWISNVSFGGHEAYLIFCIEYYGHRGVTGMERLERKK
jgi:hypothetical protein